MSGSEPLVSVFIPTRDAGPGFVRVLEKLRAQRTEFAIEILATDTSSSDDTRDVLRRYAVDFDVTTPQEFGHGATRNAGARRARGRFVAFLSQDAEPEDEGYLAALMRAFVDESVTAAHAKQIPRPRCHPFQKLNLSRHDATAATPILRGPVTSAAWVAMTPEERRTVIAFDNVASMVRRADLLAHPFPIVSFGEDIAWSRAALLRGSRIAFAPEARVIHSHDVDRREFSDRVEMVYAALKRLTGFEPFSDRAVYLRRLLGQIVRLGRAALGDEERGFLDRAKLVLSAPYWGSMQMRAMARGAASTAYEPPDVP